VPEAKLTSLVSTMGNMDVTPKGNVLFLQMGGAVAEYDAEGKIIWQAKVTGNRATRLANGNTMVASEAGLVVELDNAGKTIWNYQSPTGYQALRARETPEFGSGLQR